MKKLSNTAYFIMFAVGVIPLIMFPNPSIVNVEVDDSVLSVVTSLRTTIEAFKGKEIDQQKKLRFAVGYNGNIDYNIPAAAFMEAIAGDKCPENTAPIDDIHTLDDFLSVFGHYFGIGGAAERFIQSDTLWELIEAAADSLPEEQRQVHPGGQGTLMGNRLAKAGYPVLLGALVGPVQETLVHSDVVIAGSAVGEERTHNIERDDPHMILDYPAGVEWCGKKSPRANRFIISRDIPNSRLGSLELMHDALEEYGADVVVVSGMHLLAGQDDEFRRKRLSDVVKSLAKLGDNGPPVHLELAGMSSDMLELILEYLSGSIDSLGMNEQELLGTISTNTVSNDCECKNKNADADECFCMSSLSLSDAELATKPAVDTVVSALVHVLSQLNRKAGSGSHSVSRIHFHTVSFHAIAQIKGSGWADGSAAVAQSVITASLQACGHGNQKEKDEKDDDSIPTVVQLDPSGDKPGEDWVTLNDVHVLLPEGSTAAKGVWSGVVGDVEVFVAPLLNCKTPGKTVGLGDSISATGLAHHKFKRA